MSTSCRQQTIFRRLVLFFHLVSQASVALWLASSVSTANELSRWQFAGWYGAGAFPSVSFDPHHQGRIYVTSDVAGMWRSDDNGDTWHAADHGLADLDVAAVASAPSEEELFYAATRTGLYRSQDSGANWLFLSESKPGLEFRRGTNQEPIAIDPSNGNRFCVGTFSGGVYCSGDGGLNWTNLGFDELKPEASPVSTVRFIAGGSALVVAAEETLAKYDFSSAKWSTLLQANAKISDIISIETPGGEAVLLTAVGNDVYYSRDEGQTWTKTHSAPGEPVHRLAAVNSNQRLRIIAATKTGWSSKLFATDSLGKSWTRLATTVNFDTKSNPTRRWTRKIGPILSLKISPHDPDLVIFSDYWGVFKSTDGGKIFDEAIRGLANTVGSDLVVDGKGRIWVVSMDTGLLMSADKGVTYTPIVPRDRYRKEINGHFWRIIDVSDNTLLVTNSPWSNKYNQLIAVNKASLGYTIVGKGLPKIRPKTNTFWGGRGLPRAVAQKKGGRATVYIGIDGEEGGLFLSTNEGRSFRPVGPAPPDMRFYNGLAVTNDPNARLILGSCGKRSQGGVHFFEGGHWTRSRIESACILDAESTLGGDVYVAGRGRREAAVFRSNDRGESFQEVLRAGKGASFEALASHPSMPNIIAASLVYWYSGHNKSAAKIFLSVDSGNNWRDITGDLDIGRGAAAMAFDPNDLTLYANLYAGSVYKLSLSQHTQVYGKLKSGLRH